MDTYTAGLVATVKYVVRRNARPGWLSSGASGLCFRLAAPSLRTDRGWEARGCWREESGWGGGGGGRG